MGNMVFIPLTDEILYEHPELIRNKLVPFRVELPIYHWLKDADVEIEYSDGRRAAVTEYAA